MIFVIYVITVAGVVMHPACAYDAPAQPDFFAPPGLSLVERPLAHKLQVFTSRLISLYEN
jgi:hypothetical protein